MEKLNALSTHMLSLQNTRSFVLLTLVSVTIRQLAKAPPRFVPHCTNAHAYQVLTQPPLTIQMTTLALPCLVVLCCPIEI